MSWKLTSLVFRELASVVVICNEIKYGEPRYLVPVEPTVRGNSNCGRLGEVKYW